MVDTLRFYPTVALLDVIDCVAVPCYGSRSVLDTYSVAR